MHDCLVGGHQGIKRTVNRIKLYKNWTGLERDVKKLHKKLSGMSGTQRTRNQTTIDHHGYARHHMAENLFGFSRALAKNGTK